MKNVIATSALLILVAGAASAAGNQTRERPDPNAVPASAAQTIEVKASTVYSNSKELARAGLMSDDSVEVTVVPSTGVVDMRSRDN